MMLASQTTVVESDRTFHLRMEYQRSLEEDYLRQTYPVCPEDRDDLDGLRMLADAFQPSPEDRMQAASMLHDAPPMPRTMQDLLDLVSGFLTTLGLEPDRQHNSIWVEFAGLTVAIELEDINARERHYDEVFRDLNPDMVA